MLKTITVTITNRALATCICHHTCSFSMDPS
uniref:Uncharacterized protein n=1 Tax=Setaria italica TaxID=4555 RepID=K3XU09_SETIT